MFLLNSIWMYMIMMNCIAMWVYDKGYSTQIGYRMQHIISIPMDRPVLLCRTGRNLNFTKLLMDSGGSLAQGTGVLLVALKKTDRRFVFHEDPMICTWPGYRYPVRFSLRMFVSWSEEYGFAMLEVNKSKTILRFLNSDRKVSGWSGFRRFRQFDTILHLETQPTSGFPMFFQYDLLIVVLGHIILCGHDDGSCGAEHSWNQYLHNYNK